MWNDSEDSGEVDEVEFDSELDDFTAVCPHCQSSIYEDSVRCNHCGNYIVESSSPWSGYSVTTKWLSVFLVVVLILLIFVFTVIGRF